MSTNHNNSEAEISNTPQGQQILVSKHDHVNQQESQQGLENTYHNSGNIITNPITENNDLGYELGLKTAACSADGTSAECNTVVDNESVIENTDLSNECDQKAITNLTNEKTKQTTLSDISSNSESIDVQSPQNKKCDSNDIKSSETNHTEQADCKMSDKEIFDKLSDSLQEALSHKVNDLHISAQKSQAKESLVVIRKQTESLTNILAYGDSSSDSEASVIESFISVCDDTSDEDGKTNSKKAWRSNIDNISGSSDSESDSSSEESLSSESDTESESASVIEASDDGVDKTVLKETSNKGAVKKCHKTGYDLEEFLPPVPDLSKLDLNIENEKFLHIGRISAIISEIVTVEAIPGTPAFDIDTCLFIDDGKNKKPLGPIFDVVGPVAEPIYCIRFNTAEDVKDLNLKSDMKVYAAPKSDHTKYIFLRELLRLKGSDASWMNDQEEPPEMADYSDDEKEHEARRRTQKSNKRKLDDSVERHKRYERTMNQCNILNTKVSKLMDAHRNTARHIRPNNYIRRSFGSENSHSHGAPSYPLAFDPSVPPPGFRVSLPDCPLVNYNFNVPASLVEVPVPPSPLSLETPPPEWGMQQQNDRFRTPPDPNIPRSGSQHSSYSSNNDRNF